MFWPALVVPVHLPNMAQKFFISVRLPIAHTRWQPDKPRFSPIFYLGDLMGSYFAAAGMMAALLRRSIEGGSYHVKISLARSVMWVQELGFLDTAAQASIPEKDIYPVKMTSIDSVYGKITFPAQPLVFSNLALPYESTLTPYGADAPEWSDLPQSS